MIPIDVTLLERIISMYSTFLVFSALVVTLAVNIFLSHRDRQRQSKIETARVFLDILQLTKETRFVSAMNRLSNPNSVIDLNTAAGILSFYEPIATLWYGKTLNEEYVKSFFGGELKNFRNNKSIMIALKETHDQHGYLGCPNLVKLIERSKTWK